MTRRWLLLAFAIAVGGLAVHATGNSPELIDERLPLRTDQRARMNACEPVGASAVRRALFLDWLPDCAMPQLRTQVPRSLVRRLAARHRDPSASPRSRLLSGLLLFSLDEPAPMLSSLLAVPDLDPGHRRAIALHDTDPLRLDPTLTDSLALYLWSSERRRPAHPERLLQHESTDPSTAADLDALAHLLWQEHSEPEEQHPRLRGLSAAAADVRQAINLAEGCAPGPSPRCTRALRSATAAPGPLHPLDVSWPLRLDLNRQANPSADVDAVARWAAWLDAHPEADRPAALIAALSPGGPAPATSPVERLRHRAGGAYVTAWTAAVLGELAEVPVRAMRSGDDLVLLQIGSSTFALTACGDLQPQHTPNPGDVDPLALSRDALLAHVAHLELSDASGLAARLLHANPEVSDNPSARAGARLGLSPRAGTLDALGPRCGAPAVSPDDSAP